MGCASSSQVKLNVYNLATLSGAASEITNIATMLNIPIEGIWHSGIVINGREYFYGGGVGVAVALAGRTPYGKPHRVVPLGHMVKTQRQFERFLKDILPRYSGAEYHLFKHNCNVFSNEVSMYVTGNPIPDYVLKQKELLKKSKLGALIGVIIEKAYDLMWEGNQRMNARPIMIEEDGKMIGDEKGKKKKKKKKKDKKGKAQKFGQPHIIHLTRQDPGGNVAGKKAKPTSAKKQPHGKGKKQNHTYSNSRAASSSSSGWDDEEEEDSEYWLDDSSSEQSTAQSSS